MFHLRGLYSRIYWKICKPTLFSVITLLLVIPCLLFFPERYAWENGVIENIQLFIIVLCFVLALNAKNDKSLFRWVTLVCIILFLREINCGRIFFPSKYQIPNMSPTFMKWSEILPERYSMIPNIIYGMLMIGSVVYLFCTNAFRRLLDIVINGKIDGINFACLFIGIGIGILSENRLHNEMLEEMMETLFYVSFTVIVYVYGYGKEYCLQDTNLYDKNNLGKNTR